MTIIELRKVTKVYTIAENSQAVLSDVDFKLQAGEFVAIMGASGSGKTTLMNILGLLDTPTTGQYFLQDREIQALTEDERAALRNRTIGFVFQSFFLLPRLNVLQNVSLPLHYRNCPKDEMHARAMEMLRKVGLEKLAHHKPNQLSGGQQQRAAIARALIGQPAVILADEPTGALDSHTGQIIMDLFKDLNKNERVTTIIVTHDPKIADQCQRTVHIQDGKIN